MLTSPQCLCTHEVRTDWCSALFLTYYTTLISPCQGLFWKNILSSIFFAFFVHFAEKRLDILMKLLYNIYMHYVFIYLECNFPDCCLREDFRLFYKIIIAFLYLYNLISWEIVKNTVSRHFVLRFPDFLRRRKCYTWRV